MFLCCSDVYLKLAPWRPRMSTPQTNFIRDAGGALGDADISMNLRAETLLDGVTSSSGVSPLSGWTQRKYASERYKPGWPTTESWPEDRKHTSRCGRASTARPRHFGATFDEAPIGAIAYPVAAARPLVYRIVRARACGGSSQRTRPPRGSNRPCPIWLTVLEKPARKTVAKSADYSFGPAGSKGTPNELAARIREHELSPAETTVPLAGDGPLWRGDRVVRRAA